MNMEARETKQLDLQTDKVNWQMNSAVLLADAPCLVSTNSKSVDVLLPPLRIDNHSEQLAKPKVELSTAERKELKAQTEADKQLIIARDKFYEIAKGGIDSNDVKASQINSEQLLKYVKGPEFRHWVAAEKAAGREVFWPTDVDKTLSSGDTFTYFFKWRADHNKFSPEQLQSISEAAQKLDPDAKSATPEDVLHFWQANEKGGQGIGLMQFWNDIYWPSQQGMTMNEKVSEAQEFAKTFSDKIYPLVPEINKAIEDAGAHVVIISNGDQEIAKAIAPALGINPDNVVAGTTVLDSGNVLTGKQQNYNITDKDWAKLPQPGKEMNFQSWLEANKSRFGLHDIDKNTVTLAGYNGDTPSADGGMMIFSQDKAIADFMVDTPGDPQHRINAFYELANKFGSTKGEFVTLHRDPSAFDKSNYKW